MANLGTLEELYKFEEDERLTRVPEIIDKLNEVIKEVNKFKRTSSPQQKEERG